MDSIDELVQLLSLEKIEENIFRGNNYKAPWGRVFGGQVLAQALHAAHQTVEDKRSLHSFHAYFLLTGDLDFPIIYDVDRSRDGGSFTTRRVVAIQKGKPIFITSASFHKSKQGFDHQFKMPDVPYPEELKSQEELIRPYKSKAPLLYKRLTVPRPIEFRPVNQNILGKQNEEPHRMIWMKAKGPLPSDLRIHQQVLAYSSDYNLLGTALLPHRESIDQKAMFLASLDHAMWFHRPFKADQWLLYHLDSPSASSSRGFTRGNIFTQNGELIASTAQEGLMALMR